MGKIARFTVNLEPEQVEALRQLARQTGCSASSLVRNAVDSGLRDTRIFMPPMPSVAMHSASRNNAGDRS